MNSPTAPVISVRRWSPNLAFISSNADLDFASAPGFDFLTGNLDDVNGALNLDFGSGRHKLMVSDEGTSVGDSAAGDGTPVVITDTVGNVPGGAAGAAPQDRPDDLLQYYGHRDSVRGHGAGR